MTGKLDGARLLSIFRYKLYPWTFYAINCIDMFAWI